MLQIGDNNELRTLRAARSVDIGGMLAHVVTALLITCGSLASIGRAQPGHEGHHTATPVPRNTPTAIIAVDGQPLAANIARIVEALDLLGMPLPRELQQSLADAGRTRDAARLQQLLDPQVLLLVNINPEARVKVARGPAVA